MEAIKENLISEANAIAEVHPSKDARVFAFKVYTYLTGEQTMKITLRINETDPEMVEMWAFLYGGTPSLMAVVNIDTLLGLVKNIDDLDLETVVEMKVVNEG